MIADADRHLGALATLVAAQAAVKQAAIQKDAALDALVASMRSGLNCAENQVSGDDAKLAQPDVRAVNKAGESPARNTVAAVI